MLHKKSRAVHKKVHQSSRLRSRVHSFPVQGAITLVLTNAIVSEGFQRF